ncbi:hypothetical protein NC652_026496 [Populus alba x Populus x berolinensis]|nr:hypothetical protein NC652_026496 [Populus alba x Populus x berolinensis]
MLEDWSGMDREKTKEYILKCQSYDGGFGMIPGSESHVDRWWNLLRSCFSSCDGIY